MPMKISCNDEWPEYYSSVFLLPPPSALRPPPCLMSSLNRRLLPSWQRGQGGSAPTDYWKITILSNKNQVG
jgi:hypothetical protein